MNLAFRTTKNVQVMNNRDNIIKCGSLGLKMFLLQTILVMESGYI